MDKSWMLNPTAIREAKDCINLIRSETGVKLRLSDPSFIQQLNRSVQVGHSVALKEHYSNLLAMAGSDIDLEELENSIAQDVESAPYTGNLRKH